ncbi:hypothetical protein RT41_GL000768 [Lactococcus fujiensis JCM 16395]|uniref:Gram-positive cocci surface proteins LPxTG domain-containing protein n=2 Tax=Lactococcus fujiensis TaxID=610251 RepID=A0A2A5RNT3_9LACT|nr:hypothetical protein RT41_GL000768 [Lactococcus fujiensis JCM 16395]
MGSFATIPPSNHVLADTGNQISQTNGITGSTNGIVRWGQPQKTVPGNGQPYVLAQGITVYGEHGNPVWTFKADDTAQPTTIIVYACGVGNKYVTYTIKVSGAGSYVLDATSYGSFNQGLATEIIPLPVPDVSGQVNVNYKDKNGNEIAPLQSLPSKTWKVNEIAPTYTTLNTTYSPTTITYQGKTYTLDQQLLPANANGSYLAGETVLVTYFYDLVETPAPKEVSGSLLVHYVDTNGTTIKTDSDLMTKSWLDNETAPTYTTWNTELSPQTITYNGETYQLLLAKKPTNADGSYAAGMTTEVTYVYQKNETPAPKEVSGSLLVHYVDTNGTTIKTDSDLMTKSWLDNETAPTYTTWNTELSPQTITYNGETYQLLLAKKPTNADGSYAAGMTTEVTYVYQKNETPAPKEVSGSLLVHYVDTNGTTIKTDSDLMTKSWLDNETAPTYTTWNTELSPQTITYNGETYQLLLAKKPTNADGSYAAGMTTEVTYVYQKNETPAPKEVSGSLLVHYVDTNGTTIKTDSDLMTKSWLDNETAPTYTTWNTELSPQTITYNGETYQLLLAKKPTNADGSYAAGMTTEVTYVYQLVEKPTPPVVTPPTQPIPLTHPTQITKPTMVLSKHTKAPIMAKVLPQTGESQTDSILAITGSFIMVGLILILLKKARKRD